MEYTQYESPSYTVTKISDQWSGGHPVDQGLPAPITWEQFAGDVSKQQYVQEQQYTQEQSIVRPPADTYVEKMEARPVYWYTKYVNASILAALCCLPIGICAIIRSCLARTAAQEDRTFDAHRHIQEARLLIPLAICCGLVILAIVLALYFTDVLKSV